MAVDRPSEIVLSAFGAGPDLRRLPGGQGTSWVAGPVVLKPGDGDVQQWLGWVISDMALERVRVATPLASSGGAWSVDGWTATSFVAGGLPDLALTSSLSAVVEAGRAFHRAISHLPRPALIDARDDPWAVADRVAWGERRTFFVPELESLAARLLSQPDPPGEAQLVHGDLAGNVLFAPGLPPAVIDLSPYWRPPSYAEGVVVADALCYHGADASVLPTLGVSVPAVARALLFRVATTNAFAMAGDSAVDLADEASSFGRAARALGV